MKKILICDDDPNIREILEMLISLEFEDAEFIHTENGLEGIEQLKSATEFSLIVCDNNMPKARGVEVYNFNKSNKNIPYVLLSGDGEDAIAEFVGFKQDSNSYLVNKPWEEDELIDTLKSIIAA